jgi:hypothetical protein
MAVAILNEVQMFDQKIAPSLAVAKERPDLIEHLQIDLPPLWRFGRPAARSCTAGRQRRRLIENSHGNSRNGFQRRTQRRPGMPSRT